MKKIYLDSNLFLNSLLYEDEKANTCKKTILKIINKEIYGITSVLTWDEIVYVIGKNLGREIAIKEGEQFLRFPNLKFIDVNKEVILEAQKLIKIYKLKPRDAIHIATALSQNCTEIITDDSDFDGIKEIKRIAL
ncbi:MAG: type II toxin-antitoxin system VapC family toxin [Nanoarchaeota archaeon]|nr:type II toxin-antitoxin system VapC family toxin [Nanoarchaeota archaeon]